MTLNDKILFELYENNNSTIEYTELVAVSPLFVHGEVITVDYINMINKMAAGGKQKSPDFSKKDCIIK